MSKMHLEKGEGKKYVVCGVLAWVGVQSCRKTTAGKQAWAKSQKEEWGRMFEKDKSLRHAVAGTERTGESKKTDTFTYVTKNQIKENERGRGKVNGTKKMGTPRANRDQGTKRAGEYR